MSHVTPKQQRKNCQEVRFLRFLSNNEYFLLLEDAYLDLEKVPLLLFSFFLIVIDEVPHVSHR